MRSVLICIICLSCTPIHYEYFSLPDGFTYHGEEQLCRSVNSHKTFTHKKCFPIFENRRHAFRDYLHELEEKIGSVKICSSHFEWERSYDKNLDCLNGRGVYYVE